MKFLFALTLVIIVLVFGLSSISQSYATARQAQAAIEASQAAKIAGTGNLILIVTLVILLAVALAVIAYLLLRDRQANATRSSMRFGQVPQTDMDSLLSAMATLLMVQAMRNPQAETDMLFRPRYEEDLSLRDENEIPWTI